VVGNFYVFIALVAMLVKVIAAGPGKNEYPEKEKQE
jgi:hypothetical protein